MVFGERIKKAHTIKINGRAIDEVDTFKYLGVLVSKTRSFFKTKQHVTKKARKSMFSVLKKIWNLDLPVKTI